MSEKKNKTKEFYTDESTDQLDYTKSSSDKRLPTSKRIRKLNPLGMRVVVAIQRDSNVSDGGLYLLEGTKQNMQESLVAEVLEVASAIDDNTDEETNVSGIPLGALVLIPKHCGIKVPWNDSLRIVETKDVLALVHEISVV